MEELTMGLESIGTPAPLTVEQIGWFKAGSAQNVLKQDARIA
jgi:hypothetical protein